MGPPESELEDRNLRKRSFNVDYNETEGTVLDRDLVNDCGFIKVTGVVFAKWKRMRETLCMTKDEELLVLLLDTYQKYQNIDDEHLKPCEELDGFEVIEEDFLKEESESESKCPICWQVQDDPESPCAFCNPKNVVVDAVIDFSATANDSSNKEDNEQGPCLPDKTFAELSLPRQFQLNFLDQDWTLFTKTFIPAYTQIGPMQGNQIKAANISESMSLENLWLTGDGSFISTKDPEKCNWLRYLKPASQKEERNLIGLSRKGLLFFVTCQDLHPDQELKFWIDEWMDISPKNSTQECLVCNVQPQQHPLYQKLHDFIFHDPAALQRKLCCKFCGFYFRGNQKLLTHIINEHDGQEISQCDYCRKYFFQQNFLELHQNYGCSSNPNRSKLECELCGIRFANSQKLRGHVIQTHIQTATEVKDNMGDDLSGNLRHSKDGDNNEGFAMRVVCPKCGKTFKNKSNLKIHMLTHSGVKPFGCRVASCNQGFTTKQCLQFHYKKHHGFNRDNMPKIDRKVPYTLAAYSGGIIKNTDKIQQKLMPSTLDMMEDEPRAESPIDPSMCVTAALGADGDSSESPGAMECNDQGLVNAKQKCCGGCGRAEDPSTSSAHLERKMDENQAPRERHIPCATMPPMERITQAQRYKVATERYGTELVERFFKDQNNGQDLSEDLPNTPFYRSQYMG